MSSLETSLRPLRTALTDISLLIWVALSAGLVLAAMLMARVSSEGFLVVALALLGMAAVGSLRWPRAMLVLVVLSPILDRFVITPSMPANVEGIGQYAAEALLAVVATVLAIVGLRNGRLLLALRHPTTIGLGLFVILSLVSAVINRIPPLQMVAGFSYTLDALIVFYLCRVIGFTHRQAMVAIGAVGGAVLLMAVIGVAQGVLGPGILGLNAETVHEYIQYIADRRLERIRLSRLYGTANPFPWMSEIMDLKKEKNFFETRVTEYQTSANLQWE
jgi:hypothetical protein